MKEMRGLAMWQSGERTRKREQTVQGPGSGCAWFITSGSQRGCESHQGHGFYSEKNEEPLKDFEQRSGRYYMTYVLKRLF